MILIVMWKNIMLLLIFADNRVTCSNSGNKSDLDKKVRLMLPFFRRQAEHNVDSSSQDPSENEYPSKKVLNFLLQNAKEVLKPNEDDEISVDYKNDLKIVINPANIKRILDDVENLPKREKKNDEKERSLLVDSSEYGNSAFIKKNRIRADNDKKLINYDGGHDLEIFSDFNNRADDYTNFLQDNLKNNANLRRKLKNLANAILANQKYVHDVAENESWKISNISIPDVSGSRVKIFEGPNADTQTHNDNEENVLDSEDSLRAKVYELFKQEMKNSKNKILINPSVDGWKRFHEFETIPEIEHNTSDEAETMNNSQRIRTFDRQDGNLPDVIYYPEYFNTKKADYIINNTKGDSVSNQMYSTEHMYFQLQPVGVGEFNTETVTSTGVTAKNNLTNKHNLSVKKLPFFKSIAEFDLETAQTIFPGGTTFPVSPKSIFATIEDNSSSINNIANDKIGLNYDVIRENQKRSCIKCNNVADDWCSTPKNKLVSSTICEKANDLCYSLHTPFGIVDRGCYSTNHMSLYVCGCNMCNYIPFTDLPVKYTSKLDWIKDVYETSHLRSFRRTTNQNISCLNCTVNGTLESNTIKYTNCLEGKLGQTNTVICKQNEVCGIRAIKSQGYIWRGCLEFPKYNYYMTFCDSDLCNYDPVASLYDKTD